MANHKEIDRLEGRLQWEGGGLLTELSVQALDGLAARVRTLVFWVRKMADERPLVSLLLAFQLGLAAGKWGPGRAKR